MAAAVTKLYLGVIRDVVEKVGQELRSEGQEDEACAMQELQQLWEKKMYESGAVPPLNAPAAPVQSPASVAPFEAYSAGARPGDAADTDDAKGGAWDGSQGALADLNAPLAAGGPAQTGEEEVDELNLASGSGLRPSLGLSLDGKPQPYMARPGQGADGAIHFPGLLSEAKDIKFEAPGSRLPVDMNEAPPEEEHVGGGAVPFPFYAQEQQTGQGEGRKRPREEEDGGLDARHWDDAPYGEYIPQQDGSGDKEGPAWKAGRGHNRTCPWERAQQAQALHVQAPDGDGAGGAAAAASGSSEGTGVQLQALRGCVPQRDGGGEDDEDDEEEEEDAGAQEAAAEDEEEEEDYNAPASPGHGTGDDDVGLGGGRADLDEEDDEETLGAADDDEDEDEENRLMMADEGDEARRQSVQGNLVLALYDKVTRAKNRWKCVLNSGVMHFQGRDYLFNKANGEFEF